MFLKKITSVSFVDLSLTSIHLLLYSTFTTEIEFPFQERELIDEGVQFRNNQDTLTVTRREGEVTILRVSVMGGVSTPLTLVASCDDALWARIIAVPGQVPKRKTGSRVVETPPIRRAGGGGSGLYGGYSYFTSD